MAFFFSLHFILNLINGNGGKDISVKYSHAKKSLNPFKEKSKCVTFAIAECNSVQDVFLFDILSPKTASCHAFQAWIVVLCTCYEMLRSRISLVLR